MVATMKKKLENSCGNIPGVSFLGENVPGENLPGGSMIGGNFPGWKFLIPKKIYAKNSQVHMH